jgi:hypothetical protein
MLLMSTASIMSVLSAGTTLVLAASNEDGADTFDVPQGTTVTATNSGDVTITVSTSFGSLTITCTFASATGRTGSGLKFTIAPPTFSDGGGAPCTDSLGFSDSFSTNSTNGKWSVKELDFTNKGAGDETLAEPNATGDRIALTIPQAGLVDTNSTGCVVTAAPSGPATLKGSYDDAGTARFSGVTVPVSESSSCPTTSGTVSVSVTFRVSPALYDLG